MTTRVKRTWIQENTWVCSSCKSQQLGRYMKCQACGNPKERDEKDIVPDADPHKAVTDASLVKKAEAGPDWECEFCHGRVRNSDGKCVSCAAPREQAEAPKVEDDEPVGIIKKNGDREFKSKDGKVHIKTSETSVNVVHASGNHSISGNGDTLKLDGKKVRWVHEGEEEPIKHGVSASRRGSPAIDLRNTAQDERIRKWRDGAEQRAAEAEEEGARRIREERKRIAIIVAAVVAGVGLLVWLGFFLFGKHEVKATVASIEWQYHRDLRQKTLMHGSDWGNRTSGTYPRERKPDGYGPKSGGFNVFCTGKYYGDEDCNPYKCNPHSVSYSCNCSSYECNCRTSKSCTSNANGFSTCSEVEHCSTCQKCQTCNKTEYDTCYHRCSVHKDWCEYDYYEWPIVASKDTAGTTHDVKWPDLEAAGPDQRVESYEKYAVVFTRGKDRWSLAPKSLAEFSSYDTNAQWLVEVNRVGMIWPKQVLKAEAE